MAQIDLEIIKRQLKGELTSEEAECLEAWCAASSENLAYFHKVEKFYRERIELKEVTDEVMEKSWNKFRRNLPRDIKPRNRWWCIGSGVAACLFVGMVTFLLIYQAERPVQPQSAVIAAGSARVVLTTSTGEQIELSHDSGVIMDVAAEIVNSGKELSYNRKGALPDVLAYNKVETPLGGEYHVILSDGTKVCLGALTTLKYPVVFGEEIRMVEVTGEAYFDVVHDAGRPFIVQMENMKVEVLGTSFNVRDYMDEDFAEATLVTGKVKVWTRLDSCLLLPDHQAFLNRKTNILTDRIVDVTEFVDWKNGKLNIRNQRLEDILIRLGKWYDIQVFYADQAAKDVRFYANVDRYSHLEELLDKFEKTEQVKFNVKGNVVSVMSVK